jgi:myo-inositol-1(or 4)-monophosphatase
MRLRGQVSVREKAPADPVTEADLASQAAVRQHVLAAFPDHEFLGEEDSVAAEVGRSRSHSEFTWIVDPQDRTTNYVHGLENYCVSVALQEGSTM